MPSKPSPQVPSTSSPTKFSRFKLSLGPYRVGAQSHVASPASRRLSLPGAAGSFFLFCPLSHYPFPPFSPRFKQALLGPSPSLPASGCLPFPGAAGFPSSSPLLSSSFSKSPSPSEDFSCLKTPKVPVECPYLCCYFVPHEFS